MRPRWILAICVLVSSGIAGYALFSEEGVPRLSDQKRELDGIQQDVATLREQNAALKEDARRLRGEDEGTKPFLEQAVREELGYVRPDEKVVLTGTTKSADSGSLPEGQH